jgi:hypothetical protein
MSASVDPELRRQLKAARTGSVQAAFTLRTPPKQPYRDAKDTRATVDKIVAEAGRSVKQSPERLTVFPNAQSFALSGPAALVRKVAEHSEIASATANVQREDLLIRPVKKTASRTAVRKKPVRKKRRPRARKR